MHALRRLAISMVLLSGLSRAEEQWVRLTTAHFEMFTTAGEKKGREAILYFERVRSFFLQASPFKSVPDFPVRIVAFRDAKQFEPYRLSEFAPAYYAGNHDRDYIVMKDLQTEHYSVAIHEYTHIMISHSGLKIPVWMNEGWADLFSSLRPNAKKATAGDLLPQRMQTLKSSRWIPLAVLAAVDHSSPLYNEPSEAGMFYAESWALMHMLFLGKQYAAHFSDFVQAMSAGKTLAEASEQTWGVTVDQLEKDLHSYVGGQQISAGLFDAELDKSGGEAVESTPSGFESELALADLLVLLGKPGQAGTDYERLRRENPERPEVEESLGYLSWQSGDTAGAREHFAKAFSRGGSNPRMCLHYATLSARAGRKDQELASLKRAVDLKPDYIEARLQLGARLLADQDYAGSLAALREVQRVNPEQAQWFFGALAFVYLKNGNCEDARKNAEQARTWAKTPEQTQEAYEILRSINEAKDGQR